MDEKRKVPLDVTAAEKTDTENKSWEGKAGNCNYLLDLELEPYSWLDKKESWSAFRQGFRHPAETLVSAPQHEL